jgi:alpha-ribazole phosphatase/probable phosphoglycerate mutase
MTGARLIFVRHAEPHDEMRGRVYGSTDVELSERGRRHAEEIAARLVSEPVAAVYSSPLRRAVATAGPLARVRGVEPIVVADLREIDFGELEGLTVAEAAERYPAEAQWMTAPTGASFPGGESVAALRERAVRAAQEIAARHAGETVVIFSHAVVIRAIVANALAMPVDAMFRLDQSYGGITTIEWFDGQPYVRMVNAT